MKIILYAIIIALIVIGVYKGICKIYHLYYYYPRSVAFKYTMEIHKPHLNYDNSQWLSFDYIRNAEKLMFFMVDHYKTTYPLSEREQHYDSVFIEGVSKQLNYNKYDYIVTYQKKLKQLQYSPYLTKTKDGLYFDKKTPLIPTFDTIITDKVYIYRIKKNKIFRAPGP